MPGSGCQGHSQPGDGECKTLPHPLSPWEHPDRGGMCAVPGQLCHHRAVGSVGTPQLCGWLRLCDGRGSLPGGSRGPGSALAASSAPAGLVVRVHHTPAPWPWWFVPHEPCLHHFSAALSLLQMLDVTMSQLLNLQPSLAARVTSKHRDVKESWAQLQQALR